MAEPTNIVMLAHEIAGSCQNPDYLGGVWLQACDLSIGRMNSPDRSGKSGNDGFTSASNVTITKVEDRSDFDLQVKAINGDSITHVWIYELSEPGQDDETAKKLVDKVIKLTNVLVEQTNIGWYANMTANRTYTLNWAQLQVEYNFRNEKGDKAGSKGHFEQDRVASVNVVTESTFVKPVPASTPNS